MAQSTETYVNTLLFYFIKKCRIIITITISYKVEYFTQLYSTTTEHILDAQSREKARRIIAKQLSQRLYPGTQNLWTGR